MQLRPPCVVKAKVADATSRSSSGGWNKDILEVYGVKLDGSDMTCRGKLIMDKNSGDFLLTAASKNSLTVPLARVP
jgi:hypothetical protein